MRMCLLVILSFAALSITDSIRRSNACCMVPRSYEGTIGQSAQEAILFFDEGREELILRINYHIEGKEMPGSFAWIVTVPNEPTKYAVADPAIFKDTFDWVERELPSNHWRRADGARAKNAELEFGARAKVGPFDIQPVRALGIEALEALNKWLSESGFPTEAPDHMRYFVDNKFTFLCIKVSPEEKATGVDKAGALPPLQLSFATERPYYPLKFSSRQGIFDVNLTLLTRKPVDYAACKTEFERLGDWKDHEINRNIAVDAKNFPKTLTDAAGKGDLKKPGGEWKLNAIRASRINDAHPIAKWDRDIFFTLD